MVASTQLELLDAAFVVGMLGDAQSMSEVEDRLAAPLLRRAAFTYGQRRGLDDAELARLFGLSPAQLRRLAKAECSGILRWITIKALDLIGRQGPITRDQLDELLRTHVPPYRWFLDHGGSFGEVMLQVLEHGAHYVAPPDRQRKQLVIDHAKLLVVDEQHRSWRFRLPAEYADEQLETLGAFIAVCLRNLGSGTNEDLAHLVVGRPVSILERDFTEELSRALDVLVHDVEDRARHAAEPFRAHALLLAVEHRGAAFGARTSADDAVDAGYLAQRTLVTRELPDRPYWTEIRHLGLRLLALQRQLPLEKLVPLFKISPRAGRLAMTSSTTLEDYLVDRILRDVAGLLNDQRGRRHVDEIDSKLLPGSAAYAAFRRYRKQSDVPLEDILGREPESFDVENGWVTLRPTAAALLRRGDEEVVDVIANALGTVRRSLREVATEEFAAAFATSEELRPVSRLVRWEFSPSTTTVPRALIGDARALVERVARQLADSRAGEELVPTTISLAYSRDPHHERTEP